VAQDAEVNLPCALKSWNTSSCSYMALMAVSSLHNNEGDEMVSE
jgi:hypothetical protein